MADNRGSWWEKAYAADTQPWSIGQPQRAVVELVDAGAISGRTLDVGCGVGTHACYLASEGYETVGVDIASRAVERAERRAAERGVDVEFRVGDALALGASLGSFETVVDVGVFHAFDAIDRQRYAESRLESSNQAVASTCWSSDPTRTTTVDRTPSAPRRYATRSPTAGR